MKKITKPTHNFKASVEYFEEIEEAPISLVDREYSTQVELSEVINDMYDNPPDKRTKAYKQWKQDINKLITKYNTVAKFKCYNFVS
ncbi:hypothetical protein [Leptolyngbya phage Lbo-JY46]